MSIAGSYPESGVRIDVQRACTGGPPWVYEGEAVTPSRRFRLAARLDGNGAVTVELAADDAPPAVAAKVRLIVRAAWKHAQEDEVPPPRRIMRWRAER